MDIMHAKRKAVIFTLPRQQKITPNCNGGGNRSGRGGRWLLGSREAGFQAVFFPLSLHMCESGPPGTA